MVEIGDKYRASDIIDMGYYPFRNNSFVNQQEGFKVKTISQGKMLLVVSKEKI